MNKKTKVWVITAVIFMVIGCIVFGGVMSAINWDFKKLSTEKYETNTYTVNNEFGSISVNTNTADILFVLSQNNECKVVCYEEKNMKHSVDVRDNTLVVKVLNTKKWYEHIGINFGTPKVTVYLPNDKYENLNIKGNTGRILIPKDFNFKNIDVSVSTGAVKNYANALKNIKIKASTGSVTAKNITADTLDISTSTGEIIAESIRCEGEAKFSISTGKVTLSDVKCKELTSSGSTGKIVLNNVVATEKFFIKRSTGDIEFKKCDAAELNIKTDTGDVKGSLLTEKVFVTETDTGKIDVPKTTYGGKCEISTDTGDIKIAIG